MSSDICLDCGREYSRISRHWAYGECEQPGIDNTLSDVVTGIVMGDGSVVSPIKNPRLQITMTSRTYLQYLADIFGVYSAVSPKLRSDAAECARMARESGFDERATEEAYSDIYMWRTICSEVFDRWQSWYGSSGKSWPKDVDMTPTILTHWYACDGHYNPDHGRGKATISLWNERNHEQKVLGYFDEIPVENPSWIRDSNNDKCRIDFTADGTQDLLDYTYPVPGMLGKWGVGTE